MTLESHVFAAALGASMPSVLLILQLERQWIKELPPQCCGVLDSVFWLQPGAIYPHLECLGASGRALNKQFYVFDLFLFPLVYSTVLLGLLRRLWPHRQLIWTLPVLAGATDVVENVCILKLLRLYPERLETLETVVSVVTRMKWILFVSAVVFVAMRALKLMLARLVMRQNEVPRSSKDK